MALCRDMVELHHGRIWSEVASLGSGGTFLYVEPLARKDPAFVIMTLIHAASSNRILWDGSSVDSSSPAVRARGAALP